MFICRFITTDLCLLVLGDRKQDTMVIAAQRSTSQQDTDKVMVNRMKASLEMKSFIAPL